LLDHIHSRAGIDNAVATDDETHFHELHRQEPRQQGFARASTYEPHPGPTRSRTRVSFVSWRLVYIPFARQYQIFKEQRAHRA
jgi:hypothetical protein